MENLSQNQKIQKPSSEDRSVESKLTPPQLEESLKHFDKFKKFVEENMEPVTMILHCHLLAEYYIDQLIISNLKRGDILIDSNFTFLNKLLVIKSLNILAENLVDSLKNLNKVRNDCSHVLDYQVYESDIDKIGRPFGKDYSVLKMKYLNNTKELLFYTLMILMAELTAHFIP